MGFIFATELTPLCRPLLHSFVVKGVLILLLHPVQKPETGQKTGSQSRKLTSIETLEAFWPQTASKVVRSQKNIFFNFYHLKVF